MSAIKRPAAMSAAPRGSSVMSRDCEASRVGTHERSDGTGKRRAAGALCVLAAALTPTCKRMLYAVMCDTKRFTFDSTEMTMPSTTKQATLHSTRLRLIALCIDSSEADSCTRRSVQRAQRENGPQTVLCNHMVTKAFANTGAGGPTNNVATSRGPGAVNSASTAHSSRTDIEMVSQLDSTYVCVCLMTMRENPAQSSRAMQPRTMHV